MEKNLVNQTISLNSQAVINEDNTQTEHLCKTVEKSGEVDEIHITTEIDYVCSKCPSKFSNKLNLVQHFDNKHEKFKCPTCYVWLQKELLKKHMASVHEKNKLFHSRFASKPEEMKKYKGMVNQKTIPAWNVIKNESEKPKKKYLKKTCPKIYLQFLGRSIIIIIFQHQISHLWYEMELAIIFDAPLPTMPCHANFLSMWHIVNNCNNKTWLEIAIYFKLHPTNIK